MNKILIMLFLCIANLNITVCMEQKAQCTSWQDLPMELKSHVLSLIPEEASANSMIEIIKSLSNTALVSKELRNLAKHLINNPDSVGNLVKKYIQENPEIAKQEFITAAESGNIEMIKALLNAGINVDSSAISWLPKSAFIAIGPSHYEVTALMAAASSGHKEIAQLLLDQGANVNAQGFADFTPLLYATLNNQLPIVKMLIDKGADDINAQDDAGISVLETALWAGHEEIGTMLKNLGAVKRF